MDYYAKRLVKYSRLRFWGGAARQRSRAFEWEDSGKIGEEKLNILIFLFMLNLI